MKQTNPSNHVMPVSFLFTFFFVLFSAFILFSKICYFHFPSALNEKSKFVLVHVIVKFKSISPPEIITDAIGQIIHVTKGLVYNNTSTVTINFYNEFGDVPQREKTYSISYMQVNNFNSERFPKSLNAAR